jgi:hypothetical protein
MSSLDLYDVTFEWSDDSETSCSYRADNFHEALTEAMGDDDAMSPDDENAELLTVKIHNNSAASRQDEFTKESRRKDIC